MSRRCQARLQVSTSSTHHLRSNSNMQIEEQPCARSGSGSCTYASGVLTKTIEGYVLFLYTGYSTLSPSRYLPKCIAVPNHILVYCSKLTSQLLFARDACASFHIYTLSLASAKLTESSDRSC
jgi:hypothetical protein